MGYNLFRWRGDVLNIKFRPFEPVSDWGWVNEICPIVYCEDTSGIMAYDTDTFKTIGAFMMDNWTANSVQCHLMTTTPLLLRHGFLEYCADYVYNVRGVDNVYALVPANNEKAIKLDYHMGYKLKARLENAFEKGVDYLLMGMKREECIFLPKQEKVI